MYRDTYHITAAKLRQLFICTFTVHGILKEFSRNLFLCTVYELKSAPTAVHCTRTMQTGYLSNIQTKKILRKHSVPKKCPCNNEHNNLSMCEIQLQDQGDDKQRII